MLEIKDLHVVYRTEAGEVKAVNDVALSVKKGMCWESWRNRGRKIHHGPFCAQTAARENGKNHQRQDPI